MTLKTLGLILGLSLLAGCAHVNSVSLTPVPKNRSMRVKAEASKIIILGLSFDNDFINELTDDVKRQCADGKVMGILTKDEEINYFLYLVYKKQVSISGYCVKAANVAAAVPTKRNRAINSVEEAPPANDESAE